MNKEEKVKEKVIHGGKNRYLSAQEYAHLTIEERVVMRDVLRENGVDPDEYERGMKKLWPKVFKPKPLIWRNRG